MGNLINPIAGRLNLVNFWSVTWPVAFATPQQPRFLQLSLHLRFLVRLVLRRIFSQNPRHRRSTSLHGLFLSLSAAVWGFRQDRLSVYFALYDYKISVAMLRFLGRRSAFDNLLLGLRQAAVSRSLSLPRPAARALVNRRAARFLLRRVLIRARPKQRQAGRSFFKQALCYVQRGLTVLRCLLAKRVALWHQSVLMHCKPYLAELCRSFGFLQCFVFVRVVKTSVTASMVSRYIVLKLQQGFSLAFIVKTVKRTLRRFFTQASGYKICLSGRFTRKQIATYTWFKTGSVALNQRVSGVDYVQDLGFSRFGVFGIKLWVFGHVNQA
jgi:hypothetical protein